MSFLGPIFWGGIEESEVNIVYEIRRDRQKPELGSFEIKSGGLELTSKAWAVLSYG